MKIIVGLSGAIGSGKTSVSEHLKIRYGAEVFRLSQILVDVLVRLNLPQNRQNLQTLGEILRKYFGEDVIVNALKRDLSNARSDVVVVDGIRYVNEVEMVRDFGCSVLIYVDAPPELRYRRIVSRGEKGEAVIGFDDFVSAENRGTEKNLPVIKNLADYVVENTGTLEELYEKIDSIISAKTGTG